MVVVEVVLERGDWEGNQAVRGEEEKESKREGGK